ncbi:hypothetical protein [Nocardia colli]|uniref:hypothetical protein n=1 Tax=Nocardia colli TaxID=2545717 RepID=UPI00168D0E03|nr:hypothetical protein [Nocardia colli]
MLIDKMAAAAVRALEREENEGASSERALAAWNRLAELRVRYERVAVHLQHSRRPTG